MPTICQRPPLRVFTTAIALVLLATIALAQASRGSIAGTVKDQNGASVSGAQVALVYPQQAILRTAITDANGAFTIPNLPVDTYIITATNRAVRQSASRQPVEVKKGDQVKLATPIKLKADPGPGT